MNLIKLQCENCGATIKANEDLEKIICNYCGTEIFLDDEATSISRIEKAKLKARKENHNQNILEKNDFDLYNEKKKYLENRRNGKIKKWSLILAIITFLFALSSFEQGLIVSGIIGILQTVIFLYTYCICIEFIEEKKQGMHKLLFSIGLLLIVAFVWFL